MVVLFSAWAQAGMNRSLRHSAIRSTIAWGNLRESFRE